ncbi:MAG TPA: FlgD immunoglobulin-like domain containing protein [bacterium]|nr:FlgD immunoglobulin-like domain containing protein [bacterium]
MADLVEKFYEMDLSPSEEEALDQLLASSPEAADRFAKKAAEAYSRYGLPDLGPDAVPGRNYGWRLRVGLLAFVLVLSAGYGWWHHSHMGVAALAPENPAPVSKGAKSLPSKSYSSSMAVDKSGGVGLGAPSKAGLGAETSSTSPAGPETSKAVQGPAPAGKASRLRINVEIGQEGPVTVEIVNAQGIPVKNLYTGSLPAGNYSFSWDGKLEDGSKAQPGEYRIETHSGTTVQTQEFSIEEKIKGVE